MKDSRVSRLSPDVFIPGSSSYDRFIPNMPEQIHPTTKGYVAIYKKNIYFKNIYTGKNEWNFSLKNANKLLAVEKHPEMKCFPIFHFLDEDEYCGWFIDNNKIFFLDLYSRKITCRIQLKKEWKNFDFNEKKKLFCFTCKNGLYLLNMNGEITTVYRHKSAGVLAGSAASREEFGITKGTYWSPKGSFLAFYVIDEREITSYPLVHIQDPIASLEKIKYPMTGQKSQRVNMAVYAIGKGTLTFLQPPDEKNAYLSSVSWSPDEKYIYVAETTRSQKKCRVKRYSPVNGQLDKVLFTEENNTYVEPQHALFFPEKYPEHFVWQSRRSGFNHLFLYSTAGELVRQLTDGNWEVTQLSGYVRQNDAIVFSATMTSPLDRNICSVNIQTGEINLLSEESGIHCALMSDRSLFYIDRFCSHDNPGRLTYHFFDDNQKSGVAYQAVNPFESFSVPVTETGSIQKSTDSPELFYRITYPESMVADKKYPLIFYVYGGPHVQLIRNEWFAGSKGFEYFMASNGYIVFSIDPRGSDNRGSVFESAIWKDIGKPQLEDYQFAMDWILSEKKCINEKKMGVYGWSFGGFMTVSLMLKVPGLFNAGIAGGAVIDWSMYEVMYTERYMETVLENPDGFKYNNLRNFIGNLKGSLLLIHCDNDPVVLWQHTLSLLKKSIAENKQVDYFVYPGQAHNVVGAERLHLMHKIKKYFDDNLR
jgi:dipeptidyl-peptidase-4